MSTYKEYIISPVQLRMARAALKLTVRELGALSGVHAATVTRIENEQTKPHEASMRVLADIFRELGLRFVAADDLAGPGVRFGPDYKETEKMEAVDYDQGVAESVVDWLEEGVSLTEVARKKDMPSRTTLYKWAREQKWFREEIGRIRTIGPKNI